MGPTKVTQDDQQFNIDFVAEVKKHFCLFDSNSAEYKQAVMQDKAWQAVSQEVGESVDTCKKRWRNLRCCMTRYLKSVRDNTDLAANGRRKPYYLYNYMKFVIPYLKMKDENVSSYEASSYDEPSWTKPNSSVGGSKDASTQGEEEDEDDEVEEEPMHEIETIDVHEEEDPNQQELKQSIIQSIKILGQQPQTSSDQQQQQQPQQPQQITITETSTPAPTNAATTTYEIFTGPPVKQPRLSNSSSNCDPISTSSSHTAAIKKELLNARQFITLTAATTTPNTTTVPLFHGPTITAQHQLTPVPANFAQQASDAQLQQHQQQQQQQQQQQHQQQQQSTAQQFTFIPSAAPSQMPCDADHNFFQSLVPDIQSMTMEQKRKLKIGILQLIDSILNV